MRIKTFCLFCGSSPGNNPEFTRAGLRLGKYLADNRLNLVYGGSDCGLMGAIANSALNNGGKVTAVITQELKDICGHENGASLIITKSMSERKQKMIELSDAFIVLPGGFGTLDETFEVLTSLQLGHYHKPLGFLNINGYFDSLLDFMDKACLSGFVKFSHRQMAFSSEKISELIRYLQASV